MEFHEDGEQVISRWMPDDNFQGYINVLHGGIQATMLDEIASWLVQIKLKTAGVTVKMETRFIKPVLMDKGEIVLKAWLLEYRKRLAVVQTELRDNDDQLCTESTLSYFMYPEHIAKAKFNYPDYKDFFEKI
jgi:uncharacterized protein (TIGR00369 family)